jgi:hypothetical protein
MRARRIPAISPDAGRSVTASMFRSAESRRTCKTHQTTPLPLDWPLPAQQADTRDPRPPRIPPPGVDLNALAVPGPCRCRRPTSTGGRIAAASGRVLRPHLVHDADETEVHLRQLARRSRLTARMPARASPIPRSFSIT